MLQKDRFELLSAYLDGEVTAAESRQVEEWLAHDDTVKQLYHRLLALRGGFQQAAVTIPASATAEATVRQVMARVDRQPRRRAWTLGGLAAIGAVASAAFGLLSGDNGGLRFAGNSVNPSPTAVVANSPAPATIAPATIANTPTPRTTVAEDALMIALDQPIIDFGSDDSSAATPVTTTSP